MKDVLWSIRISLRILIQELCVQAVVEAPVVVFEFHKFAALFSAKQTSMSLSLSCSSGTKKGVQHLESS